MLGSNRDAYFKSLVLQAAAAAEEPAVPAGVPEWVLCPLTKSVMKDPVVMQVSPTASDTILSCCRPISGAPP